MPILLDLFLTFLKVGAIAFGGGYGIVALLKDEVVLHGWLTYEEFLNFIAVSESTPGPIAVNIATFVGASQAGFLGALLATFAVVLPAFLVIVIIATVLKKLLKYAGVKAFLDGIRPVVIGLIVATGITLLLTVLFGLEKIGDTLTFDWKALVIFAMVAIASLVYKKCKKQAISPILLIFISAFLGIIFYGLPIF